MARLFCRDHRDCVACDYLHPLVYLAIVALVAWFVLSVWEFAGDGYTDYLLAVVSGFILIAVLLPLAIWRLWRRNQTPMARQKGRHSAPALEKQFPMSFGVRVQP